MIDHAARLHATLATLAPIDGVSIGVVGNSATVAIAFKASATQGQRDAAGAALASFDWSAAAQQAWLDAQAPERTAVRQAAANAVSANNTYLGLATPTAAQQTAQLRALTQQMNKVIQRLIQLD